MIEKQFLVQKLKEHQIQKFISSRLAKTGYSHTEIKRTPLGEKVIIYTTRPGIVVGGRGENIQNLTNTLKKKFKMENPQIEIGEIGSPMLDINFVCDKIVSTLERFGSKRFKSIGYRTLQDIIDSGAMGAEILISGKVPGSRARTWRFSAGYLKKSGDISENYVARTYSKAQLKSGIVGIKVSIMLPDTPMPDKITFREEEKKSVEVSKEPMEKVEEQPSLKKNVGEERAKEDVKEEKVVSKEKPKEIVKKEPVKEVQKIETEKEEKKVASKEKVTEEKTKEPLKKEITKRSKEKIKKE
ncbi:MAG: 30S ribosomal protein S3 [Candidatus Woesearchaeota archaeon]